MFRRIFPNYGMTSRAERAADVLCPFHQSVIFSVMTMSSDDSLRAVIVSHQIIKHDHFHLSSNVMRAAGYEPHDSERPSSGGTFWV